MTCWQAEGNWLPDKDLNLDKQIQSLLCYRYTIGQTGALILAGPPLESRGPRRRGFQPVSLRRLCEVPPSIYQRQAGSLSYV